MVQEITRTMLNEDNILERFWRDPINIIMHILNRGKIRVNNNKTSYELWKGRQEKIK
jgi:hypothetical protein